MPNPTPVEIFGPNFTSNSADQTFTFTYRNEEPHVVFDLSEIDDSDVDPYSGDARSIVYSLLERISEWYEGLSNDAKPSNFRISRSGTLNDSNGEIFIRRNYNIEFKAQAGPLTLLSE